jgi:hybrid cluster-associated redox disulfide protein
MKPKGANMTDALTNDLAEMTIEDLLRRWPETAVIFHNHHMACPGCAVASFYTLPEAAIVYGLPPEQLLSEIQNAIATIDD